MAVKIDSKGAVPSENGHVGEAKAQYSDYPPEFRKQILALIVSEGWLPRFRTLIIPEYFSTDVEIAFAARVLQDYDEHGATPTLPDVLLDLEEHRTFAEEVYAIAANLPALKKTHNKVIEWARIQAYRLAMVDAVELFTDNDSKKLSEIRQLFLKAESTGQDVLDSGTELVKDAPEWLEEYEDEDRFDLPWPEITANLEGGIARGELGIMLAPSNGGKSQSLMNIGTHLANTVNKYNVLHITLEHRLKKVLARYAWRVTHQPLKNYSAEEYEPLLMKHAKLKLRGRVRVKEYFKGKATVDILREYMMRLSESEFYPDVVIVDYPDLLKATGWHNERRHKLREIIEDLSAFAQEYNVVVWAASQANRGSYDKKIIRMQDIAEDISKVETADVVISINATKDEKAMNQGRFFVAKARDAAGKAEVSFKDSFPAMISTGLVKREVEEEEKEDGFDDSVKGDDVALKLLADVNKRKAENAESEKTN